MPIPFRILDNRPVYFDQLGRPASGGRLDFFDAGTLTPKAVYADPSLTVSNGPSVTLDSAGRTEVDTWGDGAYKVRLYDAAGVLQSEADDVQVPGGTSQQIPPLEAGKFLTTDGALLLWDTIIQVPDPTGQNGKVLQSDGANAVWVALAAVAANAVLTFVAGGFKLSDGTTAVLVQFISGTVTPPSGTTTASQAFSFGTAFSSTPVAVATVRDRANPGGGIPAHFIQGLSAGGGALVIDTNGFNNIVNNVPFDIIAIGTVAP